MRNTRYGIIGQRTRMLVAVHRSALCPDAHLARREMTVTLREAVPPDSADRARIDDTLASLQAARSAMSAERAPGGAGYQQDGVVRSRLAAFESSLRALGAPAQ